MHHWEFCTVQHENKVGTVAKITAVLLQYLCNTCVHYSSSTRLICCNELHCNELHCNMATLWWAMLQHQVSYHNQCFSVDNDCICHLRLILIPWLLLLLPFLITHVYNCAYHYCVLHMHVKVGCVNYALQSEWARVGVHIQWGKGVSPTQCNWKYKV